MSCRIFRELVVIVSELARFRLKNDYDCSRPLFFHQNSRKKLDGFQTSQVSDTLGGSNNHFSSLETSKSGASNSKPQISIQDAHEILWYVDSCRKKRRIHYPPTGLLLYTEIGNIPFTFVSGTAFSYCGLISCINSCTRQNLSYYASYPCKFRSERMT